MGTGSMFDRSRRRLGRLRSTRMMVRSVRDRVVRLEKADQKRQKEVARSLAELTRVSAAVTKNGTQLTALAAKLDGLQQKMKPFTLASDLRQVEHNRLRLQFGAIEQRLGHLDQRMANGTFVADAEGTAQARDLVQAIRREHEQIRARMQVVSAYEERLRRVEETLALLYDGDPRQPV